MKQLIEQRTAHERKFKAKQLELDKVKHQIEEINNTDFLDMTFEMYVKKSALQEYHSNQSDQLNKRMNKVRFDAIDGDLIRNITSYIRQQADNCTYVSSQFEGYENNPSNEELQEAYRNAFNEKVDELNAEAINELSEYFELVGEEAERLFKIGLSRELPAPITTVDIETNKNSKIKGVPYDYARRTSRRPKLKQYQ